MKGPDVKTFDDLKDVFKLMVGKMLENGLEDELDDEFGYTKHYYRNKESGNNRNGHSEKTLKPSFGETQIKGPRDRDGKFELQHIKKNQTTLTDDFEEKILSMYANSTISGVTDKIPPVVREWQPRPLEDVYAVVFMDAIHFHVRSEWQTVRKSIFYRIKLTKGF